jgi:catechol 2,3-dioxygenase-like lactoylglutathione lyase family enzyme
MKRFHVHLAVRDLSESVRFYSALFAATPSVLQPEYAKWMLDDPRVNFAISTRSGVPGIDHLGIQAENADELAELGVRLDAAGQAVVPEAGAECCHARSDKMWTEDPQGTRWETFHTIGSIATYHGVSGACEMSSARGADLKALSAATQMQGDAQDNAPCCDATTSQGVCCPPKINRAAEAPCCGPVLAAVKKVGCAVKGCNTAR